MGSGQGCELRPGGGPISEVKRRLGGLWGHLTKELSKNKIVRARSPLLSIRINSPANKRAASTSISISSFFVFVGGGFGHFYFWAETESSKPKGRMQAAEKTSKGRRKAASKIIARIAISATLLSPYGHFRGGQGPRNQARQVRIGQIT